MHRKCNATHRLITWRGTPMPRHGFLRHAIAGLLAFFLAAATATAQINTTQAMRIGKNALFFEDYVLAIQYFNQVINSKPYLAEPYHCRAIAKISLEDYNGALQDATMSIERNPYIMENYRIRAVARHNTGDFAGALDDYKKCLQNRPEDKDLLTNMAICEFQLKQYDNAIERFEQVARLDTTNSQAQIGIAQILMMKHDTINAMTHLEKAINLNPNDINARLQRCDIYWHQLNEQQLALDDIDKVLELEPARTDLLINRAYMRYKTDNYRGAMEDFNRVLEIDPDNTTARFNRALLRTEVGADNDAISDYEAVLKAEPANEAALHNRAALYIKTGQLRKAVAALSDILRNDPANFLALYNRAMLNINTAQYRAAIDDLTRVLAKYPKFESGYMMRAAARQKAGDKAGCTADMKKAVAVMKAKGIHVSNYNPVHHEVKIAEEQEKFKAEQLAVKRAQEEEARRKAAEMGDTIAEQTPDEVAKKFNELLTVKIDNTYKPEYNNRARGHVQNDHSTIAPAPQLALSYHSLDNELQGGRTHYMREIALVNSMNILPAQLSLVPDNAAQLDEDDLKQHFATLDSLNTAINNTDSAMLRAADFFARAMENFTLGNFIEAANDAAKARTLDKHFALAAMLQFNAMLKQLTLDNAEPGDDAQNAEAKKMLRQKEIANAVAQMQELIDDVVRLTKNNPAALYDRALLYQIAGDKQKAIEAYTEAINANPTIAEAYFNRAIIHLANGDKQQGISDLSKAGELGMTQSYSIMKRMRL